VGPIYPIYNPNQTKSVSHKVLSPKQREGQAFKDVLEQVVNSPRAVEISFSKHALKRSQQRGINFDQDEIAKISEAVNKMERKGTREALLLYKDIALLVNVKEKRVITCVNKERLKQDVFTNIDGVMIVE